MFLYRAPMPMKTSFVIFLTYMSVMRCVLGCLMLTRCIDSVASIKLQKVNKTSHANIARLKLLELLIFG